MDIALRNRYMRAAVETLSYVKSKMTVGTTNKFFPNLEFWTLPKRFECKWKEEDLIDADMNRLAPQLRGQPEAARRKAMLESWAHWAGELGCGNCGPQSAMAFVRLRDHCKVFPLDWAWLKNGDHGFVVIGREDKPNQPFPIQWNSEAVICDPWHGTAEEADMSALRGKQVEVLYRQESAAG